jgi:hypothetical protein
VLEQALQVQVQVQVLVQPPLLRHPLHSVQ